MLQERPEELKPKLEELLKSQGIPFSYSEVRQQSAVRTALCYRQLTA